MSTISPISNHPAAYASAQAGQTAPRAPTDTDGDHDGSGRAAAATTQNQSSSHVVNTTA